MFIANIECAKSEINQFPQGQIDEAAGPRHVAENSMWSNLEEHDTLVGLTYEH